MTLQNGQADERRNARWNRFSVIAMAVGFGMLVAANVLLSLVFSGFFDGTTLTDVRGSTMVAPTATAEVIVRLTPTSTVPTATEEAAPTAEPTQDAGADGMLPALGRGPGGGTTSLRQYLALGFLALSGFALLGTTLLVRRRVSGTWFRRSS
jgi:hypothetical protein